MILGKLTGPFFHVALKIKQMIDLTWKCNGAEMFIDRQRQRYRRQLETHTYSHTIYTLNGTDSMGLIIKLA